MQNAKQTYRKCKFDGLYVYKICFCTKKRKWENDKARVSCYISLYLFSSVVLESISPALS